MNVFGDDKVGVTEDADGDVNGDGDGDGDGEDSAGDENNSA